MTKEGMSNELTQQENSLWEIQRERDQRDSPLHGRRGTPGDALPKIDTFEQILAGDVEQEHKFQDDLRETVMDGTVGEKKEPKV